MSKRPAFQFYPSDWRNDPGLRLCSCGARGLWMDMLCLMHEGQPYGFLTVLGRPIDAQQLARLVGESAGQVRKWLNELKANEVYSVDDAGVIFSRRMVRDEDLRERRAAGGPSGASHGPKGAAHGSKGGRPSAAKTPHDEKARGETKPPLKPPPSSSSSSSSSSSGSDSSPPSSIRPRAEPKLPDDLKAVWEESGIASPPHPSVLKTWYDWGATLKQDILPVVRSVVAREKAQGKAPSSFKYFDGPLREKLAEDKRASETAQRNIRRWERLQAEEEAERRAAAGGA